MTMVKSWKPVDGPDGYIVPVEWKDMPTDTPSVYGGMYGRSENGTIYTITASWNARITRWYELTEGPES